MLLGLLVGDASGRNFALSNQSFRTTFREVIFSGIFGNFKCQMTLEGSMHARTFPKTAGTRIGYITAARLGPCVEGTATLLTETLPWNIRYGTFTGTLPNITALRPDLSKFSILLRDLFGVRCLAESEAATPLPMTFERFISTRDLQSAQLGGTIPADCGASVTVESDRGTVTLLNNTAKITLTLI